MSFEQTYFQFKFIIFVLLKKYHIKYNREKYTQSITIKMWELTQKYSPHHSVSLKQFLYFSLNWFLIDMYLSKKQLKIKINFQDLKKQKKIQFNIINTKIKTS